MSEETAETIRKLILESDLSIPKIASIAQVHLSSLYRFVDGTYESFSTTKMDKILDALGYRVVIMPRNMLYITVPEAGRSNHENTKRTSPNHTRRRNRNQPAHPIASVGVPEPDTASTCGKD